MEAQSSTQILNKMLANSAFTVTPEDNSDLSRKGCAIFVGGAGDIKVDMHGTGTAIVFAGVPAGTMLPILVDRVYSTDTDATNIVALYSA